MPEPVFHVYCPNAWKFVGHNWFKVYLHGVSVTRAVVDLLNALDILDDRVPILRYWQGVGTLRAAESFTLEDFADAIGEVLKFEVKCHNAEAYPDKTKNPVWRAHLGMSFRHPPKESNGE